MRLRSLNIFICLMLLVSVSYGKSFHFDYQKNIDVSGSIEISISNTSGIIEIEGGPVSRVTIDAVKHVRATDLAEAERVADHIEIKADKKGKRINIETRYLRMADSPASFWEKLLGTGPDSFGSVDFKLTVPLDCGFEIENISGDVSVRRLDSDVKISGSSGDVTVADLKGRLEIGTASGMVKLTEIMGDIDIAVTSADVFLKSIQGAVDIRSTSGKTEGQYISGPLTITQTSGNTSVTDLHGNARIRTNSGEIKINQESGSLELFTRTGDVEARTELDSTDDFYVETASGQIKLSVPETASGSVKLETTSGSINTELPLSIRQFTKSQLVGDFGEGGPRIFLLTSSGDITISQF